LPQNHLLFPYLCPLNPIIMENKIQTAPETQTDAADCDATNITKCLNCGTEFEGKYCPECGQKADTSRFTMKFISQNLLTAILSNDGGVWFTLKNLFTRPGAMVVEILNGKRKRYFSPFPMLFFTLTVYLLLASFTGSRGNIGELESSMKSNEASVDIKTSETDSAKKGQMIGMEIRNMLYYGFHFYNNHYTAVFLLTLPLFTLAARACYGKKNRQRYTWAEYLVAIVYAIVIVVIYRCLVSLVYPVSETVSDTMGRFMPIIITMAFTACFHKMMEFSIGKTAWRSVLAMVMYYGLLLFLMAIGIGVFAIILANKYH